MGSATRALPVEIGLTAAIVALRDDEPLILVAAAANATEGAALPFGPFDPLSHRTFEIGLRAWTKEQTGVPLGYVEQLYTFGDRGRHAEVGDRDPHMVSVGYLALTLLEDVGETAGPGAGFRPWYDFFPWEDWRGGKPAILASTIMPALDRWAQDKSATRFRGLSRRERINLCFGPEGDRFDEENVLDRYELLYSAGLVAEAWRDGRPSGLEAREERAGGVGEPMRFDHRRILATAMGRLRAKMKYRPVIFELMQATFSLTELQRTVEAITGRHLHKQNFRRLVEAAAVVEPTGRMSRATGGRPAALYRFRRDVVQERPAPGLKVGMRA